MQEKEKRENKNKALQPDHVLPIAWLRSPPLSSHLCPLSWIRLSLHLSLSLSISLSISLTFFVSVPYSGYPALRCMLRAHAAADDLQMSEMRLE